MFRPRIIPVLLLRNRGLVKSVGFKKHTYIGDPINAVRIFNDSNADELVFLDIDATKEKRLISLDFVREAGEEANMPFAAGGGIRSIDDIRNVINSGAEKVVIGTYAVENPDFIRQAVEHFGSSTIVVCIDVKKKLFGAQRVWTHNGSKDASFSPVEFAKLMEEKGAGELILQSIERDGQMDGYDLDLIKAVSDVVTIPVVALGGAGNSAHLRDAFQKANATGLAAGSLFVYQGVHKGVLINYPGKEEKDKITKE